MSVRRLASSVRPHGRSLCHATVLCSVLALSGCGSDPEPSAPVVADAPPAPDTSPPTELGEDGAPAAEVDAAVFQALPELAATAWPVHGYDLAGTHRSPLVGAESAQVRWTFTTSAKITGAIAVGADGVLYVGSADGNVYALGSDGTERWIFSSQGAIGGAPALSADGGLYVGSEDTRLYALRSDGRERWRYEAAGPIAASPLLVPEGRVVVGSDDGSVHAVDLDGALAWSFPTGGPVRSSAVRATDGTIVVGSDDNHVYALDPEGAERWRFDTGGDVRAAPAIADDGTIYVGTLSTALATLYALTSDGSVRWKVGTEGPISASVAIAADGTVYAGTQGGALHAFSPAGQPLWLATGLAHVAGGPVVDAAGTIFVGGFDTRLHAFAPGGVERWVLELGGLVWTPPTIGPDGTVYVARDGVVTAVGGGSACEGEAPDCDDGDPCTVDRCDPPVGCVHTGLCDDGNPCTEDTCAAGECGAGPIADGTSCDDGLDCTTGGTCSSGLCVPTTNLCGPAPSTWPMRGRDPTHQGRVPFVAAQSGGVIWSYGAGATISSSPALAPDGTAYVGDADGVVHAVGSDGVGLWKVSTDGAVASSPAVTAYGTVVVGSADTKVWALSADGDVEWTYKTAAPVRSSPVIAPDGTLVVGSEDGFVHAIRPNGEGLWKLAIGAKVASSPAVAPSGRVFVGAADGRLYAIDPGGTVAWTFQTPLSIEGSSPAIGDDGTVYIGTIDKRLYAVNPDGTQKWAFLTGDRIESSPALASDGIVVGSVDGHLYKISWQGTLRHKYKTSGLVLGPPALGADDAAYFGAFQDLEFSFYALDASFGLLWRFPLEEGVFGGAAIRADGVIIVGALDGALYALGQTDVCVGAAAPDCDDGNPCTADVCALAVGCKHDDGCDDGNPCTSDQCAPDGSCTHGPAVDGALCEDGLACTTGDRCQDGFCIPADTACGPAPSSWPMLAHDPLRTGRTSLASAKTANIKWKFPAGAAIDGSSPVVDMDGSVIFGSVSGKVYAVAPDGAGKWLYLAGGPVRSTAAIGQEGTVYIGADDGKLHAIRAGEPHWSVALGLAVPGSPALGPDGVLYVGSDDGPDGDLIPRGQVHAVTPTGGVAWSVPADGPVVGSVALGDGVLYAGTLAGTLVAVTTGGAVLWTRQAGPEIRVTPSITASGDVLFATSDSRLHMLSAAGDPVFEPVETPGAAQRGFALMPDGGFVLTTVNGFFSGHDAAGVNQWNASFGTGHAMTSAPIVAGDLAYAGEDEGTFYAFTFAGAQFAGGYVGGTTVSDPAVGPDGTLYVCSDSGFLFAIGP